MKNKKLKKKKVVIADKLKPVRPNAASMLHVKKERADIVGKLKSIRPLNDTEKIRLKKTLKKIEEAEYYGGGWNRVLGGFATTKVGDSDMETIDVYLEAGAKGKSDTVKIEVDRKTMDVIGESRLTTNSTEITCKIVRMGGKDIQVCYHETNDKKGVEVYSGKNHIVDSKDNSSSKKYDLDETPPKYKVVVDELIEAHHKRLEGGGAMAEGGKVGNRQAILEITVPKGKESLLSDDNEYDFTSLISHTLTKKWHGHGPFDVRLQEKISDRTSSFAITVPRGKESLLSEDNEYDFTQLISHTLTKKWHGHGSFDVRFVKRKEGGGSVNGFFTSNGKKFINVAVGKSSPNRIGEVENIAERNGVKWATVKFRDFSEDIRFEEESKSSGGSMEDGGQAKRGLGDIPNNYQSTIYSDSRRSMDDIWNSWDSRQKHHFLLDHTKIRKEKELQEAMKIEKFDLDNFESEKEWRKEMDRKINDEWSVGDIRNYLLTHIQEGQYSSGGSMATGGGVGEIQAEKVTQSSIKSKKHPFTFTFDNAYRKGDIVVQRVGGSDMWEVGIKGEPMGRVYKSAIAEMAIRKAEKLEKGGSMATGGGVDNKYAGGGRTAEDGRILIKLGIIEQKLNNRGVFLKDFSEDKIAANATFEGHDIEEYNYTDEKVKIHTLPKDIQELIDEYNSLSSDFITS